jgi:hypothetical protein
MRNQLYVVTFIAVGLINSSGCEHEPAKGFADDELVVKDIIHDLSIAHGKTTLLFRATAGTTQSDFGQRDDAIVVTSSGSTYTLRYATRYPRGDNRWNLWVHHEIGEDGTGLESPAIREYPFEPTAETVSKFRSEIQNHWSNP